LRIGRRLPALRNKVETVAKQLSPTDCVASVAAFTQRCSFAKSTKGFQSPELMRQFYAWDTTSAELPIMAVMIGYEQDDPPFDTLYVGSRRNKKHRWSFGSNQQTCRREIDKSENAPPSRDAKVLVVEWDPPRYETLQLSKQRLRLTDDELVLDKTVFIDPGLPEEILTRTVHDKLFGSAIPVEQQPIHYVQISGTDLDYIMLTKLMKGLLKNIRYLVFEYTWKPEWRGDHIKLLDVIQNLKENGLVCYWAGDKDSDFSLWRITNCWQGYYNCKSWSHIACVNTLHGDVNDLAMHIERKFLESLQNDLFIDDAGNKLEVSFSWRRYLQCTILIVSHEQALSTD
jgi:hypothetical protein